MVERLPDRLRVSDADRHRVSDFLRAAAGDGRLTIEELQERLDRAYAAKTYRELAELTADLPNADQPLIPIRRAISERRSEMALPAAQLVGGTPSGSSTTIAVFGSGSRGGRWVVPNTYQAFALYGAVELDLREAMFEGTETTIFASCLFGSIVIKVPDDIVVQTSGLPMFGSYGEREIDGPEPAPSDAPVLTVKGVAMFGSVEVQRRPRRRRRPGR